MRAKGLGLALCMAVVAFAGVSRAADISPDDRRTGMKDLPPLLSAAHVNCTLTDGRLIARGQDPSGADIAYYEAACKEGLGYVLQVKGGSKTPPTVFDCIMMEPTPGQPAGNIKCELPANMNPDAGMTPVLTAAGRDCPVSKARYVGSNADLNIYEVACQNGAGYVLQLPKAAGQPPVANPCIAYPPDSNMKCQLTTPDQQNAAIDQLTAASDKGCTVTKRRYVGTTSDMVDIFEVACADGDGFMIEAKASKLAGVVDCGEAQGIAGGCTMTDAAAIQARQLAKLTDRTKAIGFDCTVSKYAEFPPDPHATADIYELACSNRPDGGVAFFEKTGTSRVVNCLRAEAQGYRCTLTDTSALYPTLTQQIHAKKPSSTCQVSGARAYGQTTTGADLIETACSDKLPGYVLEYQGASDTPTSLLNCSQAAQTGGGGCQLPTNHK